MSHVVEFRMNGVGNAFLREPGCHHCPQCDAVKPRANTSGSLLVREWDRSRNQKLHHVLFDCGLGVTDSLLDAGVHGVSSLFCSHSHDDHFLELGRLAAAWRRSGVPVPALHCTPGTFADGPGRVFPWLFPNSIVHQPVAYGVPVVLDLGVGLKVTPVEVWHGRIPREPAIWVVEFGNPERGTARKIVLAWDMLHLVPRYPHDDADAHYAGPVHPSSTLHTAHALLADADELFVDANSYEPAPRTGHASATSAMRSLIPLLSPKRTWLVHVSGHEDSFGPLSDDHLQARLDADKAGFGLAGHPLHVARHGMSLTWTT